MRKAFFPIFAAVLAGCSSTREVRLTLVPLTELNDSRSVYVLARAVQDAAYAAESYDEVAAKVMAPDASVQSSWVLLPGIVQKVNVPLPEKGRLAIYALFKQPEGERWRLLLPSPVPEGIKLWLGRGRMCWTSEAAPKGAVGVCGPAELRGRR